MRERIQKAVLHSAVEPTEAQKKRFEAFLRKKYGQAVLLQWEQDAALENGFRLEVGADLYDWSLEGRLRQFREQLEQLKPAGMSVIPLMREAVRTWQPEVTPEEGGSVLTVGDEIATVSGLERGQLPGGGATVYHAGVKAQEDGTLVTAGGRVLGVTATAPTLRQAVDKAYAASDRIAFEGAHRRSDIGARALAALS